MSARLIVVWLGVLCVGAVAGELDWPAAERTSRPWAYNWWMGSAVDKANLSRELQRYADAGLGGIHIIPIYGAKGAERRSINFLSPQWMELLGFTVAEADRLGLGVDLTTGTGWCFGGPNVTEHDANVVTKDGRTVRPSMKVKRAAPGGEGWMLNPLYADAMRHYLTRFSDAFAKSAGPKPRAMYHDSYEYNANWSPDLLAQFAQRRGYRLQDAFAALFGSAENDQVARVKADYRETMSDLMIESAWPVWTQWSRAHGFITRNEAHGSPANLLDLYALADIPETEMFHTDRNKFVSKFASSAAHVAGKQLVAAETGTWLNEHFTETLAEMKGLVDDLFLSGVNHVFYHGTCYSPDDVAWPGWLFYAATEMNPRNAIWRDAPALNAYITRCQSILQSGRPDNEILLYWPIHDLWHNPAGLQMTLTVHARDWLEQQPIGRVAQQLWNRGYSFDYISDRQLTGLTGQRTVVVPPCDHMPVGTLAKLLDLADAGATIIFSDHLPTDVPGLAHLEQRRAEFRKLIDRAKKSRVLVGDLEPLLKKSGLANEPLIDQSGLQFIRRATAAGYHYFIVNQGTQALDGWVPLSRPATSVVIMDPMTGRVGVGSRRENAVYLQLQPGESLILRTITTDKVDGPAWPYRQFAGEPIELTGKWDVQFIQGGPALPAAFTMDRLASWTGQGGEAERFAGTALYTLAFAVPGAGTQSMLDLGKVCESARVRLNGRDCGTLIMPPYRVVVDNLKPTGNLLEVEVTNLSANRIRDLDRRKVPWKNFRDINYVNINYKPFDASAWPVRESGLIGPVTVRPVVPADLK